MLYLIVINMVAMHARVTSKQSIYVETKGSDCVRWKKQNNAEPVILNVTLIANASGLPPAK